MSASRIISSIVVTSGISITIGLILWMTKGPPLPSPESGSSAFSASVLGNYSQAAVAVDGQPCALIAKEVLLDGGSAVDAAIAGQVCNGVYSAQSMGLGGGFLMLVYQAESKTMETLDAREEAPEASYPDMFKGNPEKAKHGPLSVAVPGEIAGYWEAKIKYGNSSISWKRLFQPTVKMCREGITVSWTQAEKLRWYPFEQPKMREVFLDPKTGEPWREGQQYKRPDLADTLEVLAEAGDKGEEYLGFYSGGEGVGRMFLEDLERLGGIMTEDDLGSYRARWLPPVSVNLSSLGLSFHSVPPPGSGPVLAHILNILDNYNIQTGDWGPLLAHRVLEAFKWAFGLRSWLGDQMGDPSVKSNVSRVVQELTSDIMAVERYRKIKDRKTFTDPKHYGAEVINSDDHGTAHLSLLAPNGDAVTVTSTINLYFGSLLMSERTGIIYNDEMDDFSAPNITNYFGLPPFSANMILGGKRPLSSMCPAILLDSEGRVRMVIGAAGGTKIITAVAQAIIRSAWLGQDLKTAIDSRRLHHQLIPMKVLYEEGVDEELLRGLEERGHTVEQQDRFGSVVCAVEKAPDGRIYANADFRKAGAQDGF